MRLKKSIYQSGLTFAFLLILLSAACTSDHLDVSQEKGEPVVFALSFNNTVTRAVTMDNLWPANTEVTISNGTNINFTTGASPSTTSSVATSLAPVGDANFIWPTTDPSWSFSAWYPAGSSPVTSQTVAADQSSLTESQYNAYDLLYCPPLAVGFRQKPVTLNFLHQMSRIVVIVNSSYTENKETVTGVQFGDGHIALTGNITTQPTTWANGTTVWSQGTQNSTITMRPNAAMTNASSHVYGFECMVPPQSYATEISHLLAISSTGATEGNRTYYYGASFNMQAGYQYTYNLLISEQGVITLATVKVTDWTTGTPVSNTATIPDKSYPADPIN